MRKAPVDPLLIRAHGPMQERLHQEARAAVRARLSNQVFVRGVIEVSNFCRQNCAYCGMRRENRSLERYRLSVDELASEIIEHRPAIITDINIQSGEDPRAARDVVLPLVRLLRHNTALGISVCLGTLDTATYDALRAAGARIYIMKFELADSSRYRQLAAPGELAERLRHIRLLAARGWHVSSGFIAGLPGETDHDLQANLELASSLPLRGCSVSPFIPGEETILGDRPAGDIETTLNCIALLRLRHPDWVIPAVSALNLTQPGAGYRRGLAAGANLATINLTPDRVRAQYLLYSRKRCIMTRDRVLEALEAEGLEPSPTSLVAHYAATRASASSRVHQPSPAIMT
jgi:biotin synthase